MGRSLKPCPFCGAQPVFTEAEWMEDGRYVGMTLECCVSMHEGVGWMMARAMTPVQRKTRLEERLAAKWNDRVPTPEEAIPVAEVSAGKYGNRLMWHTQDAQETTPVGTMLYTSSAPKENQ